MLLFLSVADVKFPTIAQILGKVVVKTNSWGKSPRVASVLHMFDTSLIQCFASPCFTVMFQKNVSLGNKTID